MHLEQYISDDMVEVIEKLSAAVNDEDLKQSINLAKELQECVVAVAATTEEGTGGPLPNAAQVKQAKLIQQLQSTLSVLQVLAIDKPTEFVPAVGEDALQQVIDVVTQLNEDLSIVTTANVHVQEASDYLSTENVVVADEVEFKNVAESATELSTIITNEHVTVVEEIKSLPETVDEQLPEIKTVNQIAAGESIQSVVLDQEAAVKENIRTTFNESETVSSGEVEVVSGSLIETTQPTVIEEEALVDKDAEQRGQAVLCGKLHFINLSL